jgi:uncharacterized protein DUF4349
MSAGEFEGHEALIAELRAGMLDAPDHLQRRVLAGGTTKRRRWADMSRRRQALVLIPVTATLAVAAALVHGAFSGSTNRPSAEARTAPVYGVGTKHPPVGRTAHGSPSRARGATGVQGPTGAQGVTGAAGPTGSQGPTAVAAGAYYAPSGSVQAFGALRSAAKSLRKAATAHSLAIPKGRLIHATAYLDVSVPNDRVLTRATNDATGIVTKLGGYTQSSQINASHRGSGRAYLDLRVPLAHTQDAIDELGKLAGVQVVSQSLSTQDLEQQAKKQTNQIGQLQRAIAIYQQALASGTLTGSQRIDVQIKLANAEHQLTGTRKAHGQTVKSGTTAEIRMSLATKRHAGAVGPHKRGRLGRLLHNAAGFLGLEAIIALYILIVAVPIALLVALIWWLTTGRQRRDERRLLASA